MVVMLAPSACTANIVQLFTDSPSRRTVHAPQEVVSQPIFVLESRPPQRPSRAPGPPPRGGGAPISGRRAWPRGASEGRGAPNAGEEVGDRGQCPALPGQIPVVAGGLQPPRLEGLLGVE